MGHKNIIPNFLKKGDTIGIVAIAGKTNETHLANAISVFENWGLKILVGNHIFDNFNQFSATDENRSKDLNSMIHNAYVKAIISLRGGYGTSKILDLIDLKSLKESKKWVIGFSDITALHLALNNIGICSLHATMPTNFNSTHVISLESLKNSLFGVLNKYEVEINSLNVLGKVRGEIVGGNLSLIYSLNSTKYEINCNNKILFIEDLNEQLYHLDRMMLNLKLSGKLAKIKGLVVGGMSNMKDSETNFGKTAYEIIYDYVKEYKYPVLFNFPAGHIEKNFALVIGSEVVLTVNKSNSLLEFV